MNFDERRNRSVYAALDQIYSTRSDNHLENSEEFRRDFSSYSILDNLFTNTITNKWDIENVGGVPVDYDISSNKMFVDSSDSHTLILGSTGSKKTRLAIMPMVRNLSDAGESMIICDPKSEIYQRTAGYLQNNGYQIHAINFRNPTLGDGWNMLNVPYQNYLKNNIDKAAEQLNDIAITLMPVSSKDPYWDYSARDLFVGLCLLSFHMGAKANISSEMINMGLVLQIRMYMFKTSERYEIMQSEYWNIAKQDKLIESKLIGVVSCPDKTMSCILSTFDTHVSCFSLKPALIRMLSETTIEFENIGEKKTAIYIIIPDEKTTLHKICSVFIKQIYELLIDFCYITYNDGKFKKRINFILDEFSSLPVIEDFPQMISASRSRNIRFTLVSQSKGQIVQRYREEAETIQSNCTNWLFFYTREIDLLKEISTLSGQIDKRELIPIYRLQHLSKEKGECLIFSGRHYPYFAHLADISQLDNDIYTERPLPERKKKQDLLDIDEVIYKYKSIESMRESTINETDSEDNSSSHKSTSEELFAKLDELFGSDSSEEVSQ